MKKPARRPSRPSAATAREPAHAASEVAPPSPAAPPAKPVGTVAPAASEPIPDVQEIKPDVNPFTESDWRMVGYAWAGFALRVMLVFGAVFSIYQYLATRDETRVERTLQLVDLWEKPEYQAAQKAVMLRVQALIDQATREVAPNTPEDIAILQRQAGLNALTAGDAATLSQLRDHFERIVYFLNRLASCVEEELCSRKIADSYFRDYAVSFWSYFSDYVQHQRREGFLTYAEPIERYVTGAGAAGD
jgi:hypothetical protein